MNTRSLRNQKMLEEKVEIRRKWREQEDRHIEEMKERLAAELSLPRDKKFNRVWEIAWDYGHAGGFTEVENHFRELVDLILPA